MPGGHRGDPEAPGVLVKRGTVTRLSDGRYWARAPKTADGRRVSLGIFATEELAHQEIAIHGTIVFRASGVPTFAKYGADVLDIREKDDGVRGISQERNRFKVHLATASFANAPLDKITPADVLEWIRKLQRTDAKDRRAKRKLARSTVKACFTLASAIFQEAVGTHITGNPCIGLRVKRDASAPKTEPWTFLTLEEQKAVLACQAIPEPARLLMAFAWGTGLRQGEQWNLELRDVHADAKDPHVIVRFGSKGKLPKNGKIRRVELFGDALRATKVWLEMLAMVTPVQESKPALLWPTVTGCRRGLGAPVRTERLRDEDGQLTGKFRKHNLLKEWLLLAGITRNVRWHDLRHTCASSLVSGFWGQPWTLIEVMDHMGHSDISVTQRYAHLGDTSAKRAAKKVTEHEHRPGVQ